MDPINIPISAPQRARLDAYKSDIAQLDRLYIESLRTIIASAVDPETIGTWHIDVQTNTVVLTPPPETPATT